MIFVRNLLRAPARSLMTALGIAAGIGLFVAISAITIDLHAQITGVAEAYTLEVVVYERRATSPISSRIGAAQMRELELRHGAALTPMAIGSLNERWNAYALVVGVPPSFARRTALVAGEHVPEGADGVLLGELAAARLGLAPGGMLRIDARDVPVRGVYRTGSRMLDGGVMTGIAQAQRMLTREGAEPQFTLALLRAPSPDAADALIREIEQAHPGLRAIRGTEFAGSLRLMRVVDAFIRTISVVALVGTGLVVTNTLLMAVAERTRELGILMTVGWSPWLVLRMLMAESVVLCALGAALGNGFALLLLRAVNGLESVGFGWIPLRYPWSLAGASLLLAAAIALLALVWPAIVVLRLQPLTALRHE
ncbi:MAG: Macrolide export ATP-binding/permease protein MacB [Pseudomonadota bacterium]|jgi:putative ABC transport system permease protein